MCALTGISLHLIILRLFCVVSSTWKFLRIISQKNTSWFLSCCFNSRRELLKKQENYFKILHDQIAAFALEQAYQMYISIFACKNHQLPVQKFSCIWGRVVPLRHSSLQTSNFKHWISIILPHYFVLHFTDWC